MNQLQALAPECHLSKSPNASYLKKYYTSQGNIHHCSTDKVNLQTGPNKGKCRCRLMPNASYSVMLFFTEIYWDGPNLRLFNISANNETVVTDFDIFANAGATPSTEPVRCLSSWWHRQECQTMVLQLWVTCGTAEPLEHSMQT